jgi:hypothetical protein
LILILFQFPFGPFSASLHSIVDTQSFDNAIRASAKPSFPEKWQGIRPSMFKADVKEGSML